MRFLGMIVTFVPNGVACLSVPGHGLEKQGTSSRFMFWWEPRGNKTMPGAPTAPGRSRLVLVVIFPFMSGNER
jgi:hypothetical protein